MPPDRLPKTEVTAARIKPMGLPKARNTSIVIRPITKVSSTITQNSTTGAVTVTFAGSGSTFFIGIKYSTGAVVGKAAPSPTTVHYDFSTAGVAGSTSGIDLKKKGTP